MYKKSLGKLPSALLACLRSALMTILGLHRVWRLREPTSSSDWLFTAELISNTRGPCYMEVLSNLIGRCSLTLGYKGPWSWFRDKEDWVWNPRSKLVTSNQSQVFFPRSYKFFLGGAWCERRISTGTVTRNGSVTVKLTIWMTAELNFWRNDLGQRIEHKLVLPDEALAGGCIVVFSRRSTNICICFTFTQCPICSLLHYLLWSVDHSFKWLWW